MKKLECMLSGSLVDKLKPLLRKYCAVLIVLLAGILLLASGGRQGGTANRGDTEAAAPAAQRFDLDAFEQTLNQKLEVIEGVGRVELMLSLEETEEAVYAVNTRQSRNGDAGQSYESDLTVLSDRSYGESPVAVKSLLPVFRGAVVLCDGADNAAVRLAVTQAVATVCGIGSDKVTVLKMAPDA